jgi:MFS family permease
MEALPLPSLKQQLRALPAPAWILFGGTFVNRFGTFVMPMLVLYLTRLGYSAGQAGLAVGSYGAGHFTASMLGGHLADRIGRRNTIALSMFASAAVMLALSQARTYGAILLLAWLAGTAAELYRPASHALIGDLVPQEQRVIAFGMYRFAVNLGFAAGPATAGFLADRSFFYLFLGDAITSVGYGIIALVALPHGLRTYSKEERSGEAIRVALHDRPFLAFLSATALVTVVDFQMGSTVALHVRDNGFSAATYGVLISLNGALIVLFELLITTRVQRLKPQPVIAVGYALSGIGFALTGAAHTVPALAITVVIWTLGEMIASPMSGAYITQLAPERYRGRYMGLWVLTWSFGMVVGPTVGTRVYQWNPAVLWASCAVLGIAAALLALRSPSNVAGS